MTSLLKNRHCPPPPPASSELSDYPDDLSSQEPAPPASSDPSDNPDGLPSQDPADMLYKIHRHLDNAAHEGIDVRLIRGFVHHVKGLGQRNLFQQILKHPIDELDKLKLHLLNTIVTPVIANGGTTPAPVTPRRDVQDSIEALKVALLPASRNEQAVLKERCLSRDGYRCTISGAVETNYEMKYPGLPCGFTEVAHILPFALGKFDEDNSRQVEEKAVVWDALLAYFPEIKDCEVSSDTINADQNAMTMESTFHKSFGKFYFCLNACSELDTYEIETFEQFPSMYKLFLPAGGIVRFSSHDPMIRLPCRGLLGVHASIAHILQESGMLPKINEGLRLREELCSLAPDGSTGVSDVWWGRFMKRFSWH
ncbi:hypothetical protein K440DRAFT_7592 [Wilcoxina mikolae CBS 423.85]|nr:hypothetical protein K440DRAFT_7592 [Wilcoxina mikolae CBS 423.85]